MKAHFLTNASQNDDIQRDSMNGNEVDRQQQLHKQKMLQENLEFEQGMMVEREQRVQQIEADVLDVNEIMRDLATLINQQGEQIGKILTIFCLCNMCGQYENPLAKLSSRKLSGANGG